MGPGAMRPSESYDARLVNRFRDGDSRAMDALFDLYADRVLGLAYGLPRRVRMRKR